MYVFAACFPHLGVPYSITLNSFLCHPINPQTIGISEHLFLAWRKEKHLIINSNTPLPLVGTIVKGLQLRQVRLFHDVPSCSTAGGRMAISNERTGHLNNTYMSPDNQVCWMTTLLQLASWETRWTKEIKRNNKSINHLALFSKGEGGEGWRSPFKAL